MLAHPFYEVGLRADEISADWGCMSRARQLTIARPAPAGRVPTTPNRFGQNHDGGHRGILCRRRVLMVVL